MSERRFNIYLEFDYSKLNIAAFEKLNGEIKYYKQHLYQPYFNQNKELHFYELNKLAEDSIFEIEKSIAEFVKDIYIMLETPQTNSIKISIMKNNEGKKIIKQDVMYLIQDAKQQLLKSNKSISIIHILVENYILDNISYNFLPLNKKCKKFSIDLKFICFPKDLIKNFEKLFLKQQILINKFICSKYVKSFDFKNNQKNICERAKAIVEGINKQEVVSVPKTIKKTGFFEKLFHFFS